MSGTVSSDGLNVVTNDNILIGIKKSGSLAFSFIDFSSNRGISFEADNNYFTGVAKMIK